MTRLEIQILLNDERTLCWYVSAKHVFTFLIFKRKANYTSFLIAYFLSTYLQDENIPLNPVSISIIAFFPQKLSWTVVYLLRFEFTSFTISDLTRTPHSILSHCVKTPLKNRGGNLKNSSEIPAGSNKIILPGADGPQPEKGEGVRILQAAIIYHYLPFVFDTETVHNPYQWCPC